MSDHDEETPFLEAKPLGPTDIERMVKQERANERVAGERAARERAAGERAAGERAAAAAGYETETSPRSVPQVGTGVLPEALAVECISLVHLYHSADTDVVALRGVDLDIDAGELVALLGPSGMGKSTLLRIMAGLLRPSAGQILVGGRDVARMSVSELRRYRAVDVGIVLQDALSNLLPYATVLENLEFAGLGARALEVTPPLSADDLIELLGLGPYAERPVSTLSGGEQQLAALAAGAAAGARLLLIDEPTSQLEPHERDHVAAALHDLHAGSGATIVMVTHDPHLAASVPRTVTIRDGRVGAEGRHGTQYAVVARDGTVQLPPDILEHLPPDTLLRIVRHPDGIELRTHRTDEELVAEARAQEERP